ncbi:MAG: DEAD/DEAH box helicase [Verrucomicrobia bacterium]|nr:DEAD/DEAH box helicase [Verrucomicrobiota bacterium]NBU08546.1 DEAD/DEAH box helicase [Pseudomonadota bacterium]NDA66584.1 DEAD/DEAH box helicase [Verrucomicrobiota bacterium]NDB74941.1 DEAD/DEAH box helicase [Verrucomicrobiota bacterium]NDD38030.1 DEAD/DEAH box helicase [Verrucomicrobiota bacterium]
MSFSALNLDANILRAIADAGYTEPTPIQVQAIPQILVGHDLIGIAQTGTGKTAAFTLPLLTKLAATPAQRHGTRVLVLAPTRELVVQIEENIRAYGKYLPFKMATVFGGVGENAQIKALQSGLEIIVATPGRLLDLMGRRYSDFTGLQYLVLDEADRMLDMGFLPSIRQIVRSLPKQRQTLLFSATLSREIEGLTHEFQHAPKLVQIGRRSNPAETVTQWAYEVPRSRKVALLAHLLEDPNMNMVLVFVRMKHSADRLARQLESHGVTCATLHSNRSQNQRLRALRDFKSGVVRVLVATDIAARGIDVDGISHVVNFDFPMHSEDYVHRIGRTGRAQAIGDAISFVTPEDHGELRSLERFIGRGLVRKHAEGFDYTDRPEVRSGPPQQERGRGQQQHSRPAQPQQRQQKPPHRPQRAQNAQRSQHPLHRADSWQSGFAPEPGSPGSSQRPRSGNRPGGNVPGGPRPGGRPFRRSWGR